MSVVKLYLKSSNDGKFVYYAGENIQGSLQLILDKETRVQEISVKFNGRATIQFSEFLQNTNQYEIYLEDKITFYKTKDNAIMKAGCHKYPFEFKLPYNLPQSTDINDYEYFKKHNFIRYTCEAYLDLPWKFEKIFEHPFILRRRDDLNSYPILRQPVVKSVQKNLVSLYCCCSQKILLNVSLPYSGYVPGQNIPIKIDIENKSSSKVESILITLEESKVLDNGHVKKIKSKYFSNYIDIQGVNSHRSDQMSGFLKIPDDARISDLLWSEMIRIKHYVKIVACIEGMHFNQEISIPIVIGTISLSENVLPSQIDADDTIIRNHLNMTKDDTSCLLK